MAIQRFDDCAGTLVTESGSWIPVINSGSIGATNNHMTTEFISALGKRSVFFRGHQPRTWTISGSCTFKQAQNLSRIASMAPQKFYWISPLGRKTNILPRTSIASGTRVGSVVVKETPLDVYTGNGADCVSARVPIDPSREILVGGYITGGKLGVSYYSTRNLPLQTVDSGRLASDADLEYIEFKSRPHSLAAYAEVVGLGSKALASPSITLDTKHVNLGVGAGECGWVTIHDIEISHSSLARKGSMFDISFTLREVS